MAQLRLHVAIIYGHLNPTKICCIVPLPHYQYQILQNFTKMWKFRRNRQIPHIRGSAQNAAFHGKLRPLYMGTVVSL